MHYTIENILNDEPVNAYFRAAIALWRKALDGIDTSDAAAIASKAESHQLEFEQLCGGRWPGQEVMVWAGVCQYYTTATGFGENIAKARAMHKGLAASMCSVEIHSHADDVARLYPELLEE